MTGNPNMIDIIKARQRAWAQRQQHALDKDGYCRRAVPTGMRGADANLDVLLTTADGWLFAIESTFTEPYATATPKPFLKPQELFARLEPLAGDEHAGYLEYLRGRYIAVER